ncbi:MAG: glycosyltransferase family 2 protein [Lysobacter sp.]|nr:MAG: glycosyltransferase family 2 protein [Lysobacter sp.]
MQAHVSIALSTYNGERYLRQQLESLLAQRGVGIEIVAVDDGSTDGSISILEEYAARDSRLRWEPNATNLGPTASFERALALCSGEWLAPCDQDDVWHPDKLRTLVDAIGDADLAYCDSAYIDAAGGSIGQCLSDATAMREGRDPRLFFFANSVSGHATLLRRSLYEAARPFPGQVFHDWWLAIVAAGRNGVHYVPQPLVDFRRHADTCSSMGARQAGTRPALRDDWLACRLALLTAYATRALRHNEAAADFVRAINASAAGSANRLAALAWSHRVAAPRWSGLPALDALHLYLRLQRKARRARPR